MEIVRRHASTITLVVLLALSQASCVNEEVSRTTVSNAQYRVIARHMSGPLTTPYSLTVSYERLNDFGSGEKQLVDQIGLFRVATLELSDDNLLFVSTFDDNTVSAAYIGSNCGYKHYYLFNLDSPPRRKFRHFGHLVSWPEEDTLWADSSEGWHLVLARSATSSDEFRLSSRAYDRCFSLFILSAETVSVTLVAPRKVSLDAVWSNGESTKGLIFSIPKWGGGLIESVLEPENTE